MKWFQVDSDTPNDPKIRAVVRELGAAGVGGLFLLWCHIADHGNRRPGWSIDAVGKPMPLSDLVDASALTPEDFRKMASICVSTGHFLRQPWERRQVVAIPAMARRADTYTKRRVRTLVEPASKNVGQSSSTRQHKQDIRRPPVVPLLGGRITRRERQEAERVRNLQFGCQHDPRCESVDACIERLVIDRRQKAAS